MKESINNTTTSMFPKLKSRFVVFLYDILTVPIAWLCAFWLAHNLQMIPAQQWQLALQCLPWLTGLQSAVYLGFGLYRGYWRYASLPDLARILKAVILGVTLSAFTLILTGFFADIPFAVLPIYTMMLVAFLGGGRFVYRWFKDGRPGFYQTQRVMIVGAGFAGESLARDLLRNPEQGYTPIAFVDNQEASRGKEIHGLRVHGGYHEIPQLVRKMSIDAIVIAKPAMKASEMREILFECEQTEAKISTLPRIDDWVGKQGRITAIDSARQISLDDLLGRDPVCLDWQAMRQGITGKVVLVSGGGGSIGHELCVQLATLLPQKLVVIENSEFNLYRLIESISAKFPNLQFIPKLVDVADALAVDSVMQEYKPEVVFHAAAYKHVPMLESMSDAAIKNNVVGTQILADAAHHNEVGKFILISTDKAVNPPNIMGMTKRAAEIYCLSLNNRSKTNFITVRFGNVLGSTGSVVGLFQKQIAQGGPVTVTDPDITRYFMTIPEACQLIMQAAMMGDGGEIFVLDMGEPVKITKLAEMMIRLSGKKPYDDVDIEFIGLRPGEKLHEELFHEHEELMDTECRQIYLAKHVHFDWQLVSEAYTQLQIAVAKNDTQVSKDNLKQFIRNHHKKLTTGKVVSLTS